MKHDVFISYKSQDIVVAKAIAHILEADGISCWYAPRNLDMQDAGKDYDDKIVEAIKNTKITIVLLSDDALESKWVKREVSYAEKNDKLTIPYVISKITVENGFLMRLDSKHWIDAYPNPEKKFDLLKRNIKIALNQSKEAGEHRYFSITDDSTPTYDLDFEEGEALYKAKEYVDAVRAFLLSAEKGNSKAKSMLCKIFLNIEDIVWQIPDDLWISIETLAKEGQCYANFLMHTKFYDEPDAGLISLEYLKKSLKDGPIVEALLRLGIHYGWGLGVKPNHVLALHYYEKALELGNTDVLGYIGTEYEFGTDKIDKDIAKAIEYYEKGAVAKDKRSLRQLCNIYSSEGPYQNIEKAEFYAQTAIDSGIYDGYVWMGNMYSWHLKDNVKAKDWYKKAAIKEVKGAFSALANIYWAEGENEIAYQWAHKGVSYRDSMSYTTLGWLYEMDDNYKEAWKYYKMQYVLFGSGANNLARLYLELEYRPNEDEGYKFEDLIHALEVCARNSNEDCIDFLVNIYANPDKYKLDIVPDSLKAREYEKIGARLGLVKYIHKMGLNCLDKEDEKSYNPYKGIEWLEKSAAQKHKDSIDKLLEIYSKNGIEPNSEMYNKWCEFAIGNIENLSSSDNKRFISFIENCIEENGEYKVLYNSYLTSVLHNQDTEIIDISRVMKLLIKAHHIEGCQLSENAYEDIINRAKREIEEYENLTFGKDILKYIYPDFDYKALENGTADIDNDSLEKYHIIGASEYELEVPRQQMVWENLYKVFREDECFGRICEDKLLMKGVGMNSHKFWANYLNNFLDSYEAVCRTFGIQPIETLDCVPELIFPVPSPRWLINIRKYAERTMLQFIRHGAAPFDKISITTSDDEILDIAAKIESDTKVWEYLISSVGLTLEIEDALHKSYDQILRFNNKDYQKTADSLNEYIDEISKAGIEHKIVKFEECMVEQIAKGNTYRVETTQVEIDDFDKLLDTFLNDIKQI